MSVHWRCNQSGRAQLELRRHAWINRCPLGAALEAFFAGAMQDDPCDMDTRFDDQRLHDQQRLDRHPRFDDRMRKLADHIRLANKDVEEVRVSSEKITKRFSQIEKVELSSAPGASPDKELGDPISSIVMSDLPRSKGDDQQT